MDSKGGRDSLPHGEFFPEMFMVCIYLFIYSTMYIECLLCTSHFARSLK